MRHRLLLTLLAAGTVAGYASGFASLARWHRYGGRSCHWERSYRMPPPSPPASAWSPPTGEASAPQAPVPPGPG